MGETTNFNGILGAHVHRIWLASAILQVAREEWIQANKVDPVLVESWRIPTQNLKGLIKL